MSSSISIPEDVYEVPSEEPLEGWSQVEGEEGGFHNNDDYDYDYNYSLPPPACSPPPDFDQASKWLNFCALSLWCHLLTFWPSHLHHCLPHP
ncbi:hypothetical protein V8E53_002100 [Lactarius tabidus]